MLKTILIVDDEEFMRETIASMLALENLNVLQASSGQEAIETLTQNHVDLILSDVKMPGMDGIKTYQTSPKKPPIIFMSGLCSDEQKEQIKNLNTVLLPKPFIRSDLLREIRKIL